MDISYLNRVVSWLQLSRMCLKINLSPESELLTLMINHTHCDHWTMSNLTKSIWHNTVLYRSRRPHTPPLHSQIAHASENSSCHGNHCFALLLPAMHSFLQCVEKQIGLWQSTGGLFGNESWGDWSGWKTHEGKKTHSNQTNKKKEKSEQQGGADFGSWSFQQSGSAGTWYHLDRCYLPFPQMGRRGMSEVKKRQTQRKKSVTQPNESSERTSDTLIQPLQTGLKQHVFVPLVSLTCYDQVRRSFKSILRCSD